MVQIESSIPDLSVSKNSDTQTINIFDVFSDRHSEDAELECSIVKNYNPEVVIPIPKSSWRDKNVFRLNGKV